METPKTDSQCRITCKLGLLTRPNGSALVCQGKTLVLAGVYGPVEKRGLKVLIDRTSVEANFRPKVGLPGVGDRFTENIIKNICETVLMVTLYPRSAVILTIQEIQNRGEMISSAVNAACLALLNSGIDMKFLVAAVSCVINENGMLLVDSAETDKAQATFTFVFESVNYMIVASHTTGVFTSQRYEAAVGYCRIASKTIFDFYKTVAHKK